LVEYGVVTIVFRVPASGAERVGFSYSPSLEAVLSLHVLVEPKHHPVQHGWGAGDARSLAGAQAGDRRVRVRVSRLLPAAALLAITGFASALTDIPLIALVQERIPERHSALCRYTRAGAPRSHHCCLCGNRAVKSPCK
jgi:hypothetical protein